MIKKRILSTILTILVILLLGIVTSVYYISETVQFKEIGVEYLKVFNTNRCLEKEVLRGRIGK